MTVMTPAEARMEAERESYSDAIPDPEARARAMMEDLSLPEEFEDHGFEDTHDVAEYVEQEVMATIEGTVGVPGVFIEEAVYEAEEVVFPLVMEEFEEYAHANGLEV